MTTYLDKIEKLNHVLQDQGINAIPAAATAKLAITRPPSNFQILTADNPDMVRFLASQDEYIRENLTKIIIIS